MRSALEIHSMAREIVALRGDLPVTLTRPFTCGICGQVIHEAAQLTFARGWIHPACDSQLPVERELWDCPLCGTTTNFLPDWHVGSQVCLEGQARRAAWERLLGAVHA